MFLWDHIFILEISQQNIVRVKCILTLTTTVKVIFCYEVSSMKMSSYESYKNNLGSHDYNIHSFLERLANYADCPCPRWKRKDIGGVNCFFIWLEKLEDWL